MTHSTSIMLRIKPSQLRGPYHPFDPLGKYELKLRDALGVVRAWSDADHLSPEEALRRYRRIRTIDVVHCKDGGYRYLSGTDAILYILLRAVATKPSSILVNCHKEATDADVDAQIPL